MTSGIQTLLLTILGGGLATGIITGAVAIINNRRARRDTVDDRTADRNADYRAYAEKHMFWDYKILGRLQRVEQLLNIDEPIPEPPPLFPPAHKDRQTPG